MSQGANDLLAFLHAQLDEDERVAREAIADDGEQDGGFEDATWLTDVDFVKPAFGDAAAVLIQTFAVPRRQLAEIEAKRRILEDHPYLAIDGCCARCVYGEMKVGGRQGWPCVTARMLAQPYVGRAGWREEWAS